MHERGQLEWFDDPDLGRIVLPASPLIIHGAERVKTVASPSLGQHNQEIYGDKLGLSEEEMQSLKAEGVI
jgi:crotonobetainyl-CoA:carnitine CoA-transferase CaiB-like acyl-CoA transferase